MNLDELTIQTQASMDDASEDHAYVGFSSHSNEDWPLTLRAKLEGGEKDKYISIGMKESLAQVTKIWRANVGGGRAVVSFSIEHGFIVGRLDLWKSRDDEIEWVRRRHLTKLLSC